MADIDVQKYADKLVDLPEGIAILNLDGSSRLTNKALRAGVRSPFTTYSDGGTLMYAIVWTRADPDPDLLLAAYGNAVTNVRDAASSAGDVDDAVAERDEEWRDWLLDGSPGSGPE